MFEKTIGITKAWIDGLASLYRFTTNDNLSPDDALKIYAGTVMPTGIMFGRWVYSTALGRDLLDQDVCKLEQSLNDVEYLKSLPPESLGRAYLDFWEKNIKDNIMDYRTVREEFTNRKNRWKRGPLTDYKPVLRFFDQMSCQHDLMHVLLGYDIDKYGEIGVHGFLLSHWKIPAVKLIFTAFTIYETFKRMSLDPLKVAIEARRNGKAINSNLFIQNWNAYLSMNLNTLRKLYKIPTPIIYEKVKEK